MLYSAQDPSPGSVMTVMDVTVRATGAAVMKVQFVVGDELVVDQVGVVIFIYTKISELNLSAFICRLFHEDRSSIINTIQLSILNHLHALYAVILGGMGGGDCD